MDEIDPPQLGNGYDPEGEIAEPALSEEEAREKILKAREEMEILHGSISKLLQHEDEGGHVVSTAHGLLLSRFQFIVVELSGILASLNETLLSELVLNDVREEVVFGTTPKKRIKGRGGHFHTPYKNTRPP
nr:uncharacterized protein LOC120964880 [Aegilops tauschii subsp. strangulata]